MYPAYRTAAVGGVALLISLVLAVLFAILLWYVFRALRKYLREAPAREESAAIQRSLGEVLKAHRTRCPDDSGVCGGVPGSEPPGRLQVGERRV